MMRFNFKKGLVFIELNERWELIRRVPTGTLQFENEAGVIKNMTSAEVMGLWLKGAWVIDVETLGTQAEIIYLATPRDLDTFPERWQKYARLRLFYLEKVDPANNKYNDKGWQIIINQAAKEVGDTNPPCSSSVHFWWRKYRVNRSMISLIPENVRGYTAKRDPRYAIFAEVISKIYLKQPKVAKLEVFYAVRKHIADLNQNRSSEEKINQISRASVYRWTDRLDQDLVDASRLGQETSRKKYRSAMGGLKTDGILSRVEIDHTPLDLIVYDPIKKLPLGRPWLTLALDRYSRMVVGFYISFSAPSSYSVLQCLKRAILPKDEWLARFPKITGQWPVNGIPMQIAVDNGMDLHSDALKKSCEELGIEILFTPPGTPETKGAVERFFRTLNQGLIHKLPGTVFSNIKERDAYPAEEDACVDMDTLLYLVTKWIVDVYNIEFHRGINDAPLAVWLEAYEKSIIDLPVYPQQLEVITGIPEKRTGFHYGIELEKLHYNNTTLQEIRKRAGENLQLTIKYYMETIAYIHVFDPFKKEYFQVECTQDEYTKDITREMHRIIQSETRKKFGERYNLSQIMEARDEIARTVGEAISAKKMADRKKSAMALKHDSESVLESKNPIQAAQKPIKPKPKRFEELPPGLDDVLPTFHFPELRNSGEKSS